MREIRRWDRKFVDKRDWKEYNRVLVRRREILFDFDFLDKWEEDLRMNDGKDGARMRSPEVFIRLLAHVYVLSHLRFRQEEALVNALSKHAEGLKVPNHSTIW